MKPKKILRFYFSVEKLNGALDNLITKYALSSADCSGSAEYYAEKICSIIGVKRGFARLYNYLNGIMEKLTKSELKTLEYYAALKKGILKLPEGARREIKRVLTKFSRKCAGIMRFEEGLKLVDAYFALM